LTDRKQILAALVIRMIPQAGAVYDGYINKIKPDLGVGLWLYSRDYFIGFSGTTGGSSKIFICR
jgi:hypothetical protein